MRHGIPLDLATLEGLIDLCREAEVLVEFNQKYRLPSAAMRALAIRKGARHVFGSDAHRVEALWDGKEAAWA
jgi:histidinol phosphatase-like PHP family hydrolase